MTPFSELINRFHSPTLKVDQRIVYAISMLEYVICCPLAMEPTIEEIQEATKCIEALVWETSKIGTELLGYWLRRDQLRKLAQIDPDRHGHFMRRLQQLKIMSAETEESLVFL